MRFIKTTFVLLMICTVTLAYDFSKIVCLNDSTGRTVYISTADTTIVLKDVIYVELVSAGYNVELKDGRTLFFKKPPYKRVEADYTKDTTSTVKDTVQTPRKRKDK